MSYKALLFCPEQKTLRTVTQILSELDFEIEACHEPFAAVKRLTTEHFDAIVVDCENEQNATLLFKSSRHSSSNRAALSIAVVEGQAGVASAFRIGANLVLTKPINVEQSKGTIRVARGLLRKSDASKPAHSLVGTPASLESAVATAEPRSSTMREMPAPRLPLASAGFSKSEFELEKEPEVMPEPTEAALLESMQDPASEVLRAREAESHAAAGKLQVSNPVAGTLPAAGQATEGGRTSDVGGSGAAAAPAPGPASQESFEEQRKILSEAPMFSGSESEQSSASGKKKLIIAIVVLLLGVGVYLALSKPHDQPAPAPSAPAVTQPQAAPAPVAQPTNPDPSATAPPAQPSGDTTPAHRPSGSDKTPSSTKTPKTKKTA
jgi:DNA-binding response OmpR family regulator